MRWIRLVSLLMLVSALVAACTPSASRTPSHTIAPADPAEGCAPIMAIDQLGITGSPPREFDFSKYRLIVDGMVENPLSLDYAAVLRLPAITRAPLLDCPGFFQDCARWTGVPLTTLLDEAMVKPDARYVVFYALDNYHTSLPLEQMRRDGVFLAWQVNGETLPPAHGFPLRLVVSGQEGGIWVKWVYRLELTAE